MLYPEVSEKIPVPLSYERPVAALESMPRIVVDAAAIRRSALASARELVKYKLLPSSRSPVESDEVAIEITPVEESYPIPVPALKSARVVVVANGMIPRLDVDTAPVSPPIEVTPVFESVLPVHDNPVPAVILVEGTFQNVVKFVVDAYALAHSVVLAVSGMLYPEVSEKIPVPLSYERPVAVVLNIARAVVVANEKIPLSESYTRFAPALNTDRVVEVEKEYVLVPDPPEEPEEVADESVSI